MSKFVQNILKSLDYDKIKQKRAANFEFLESLLGGGESAAFV